VRDSKPKTRTDKKLLRKELETTMESFKEEFSFEKHNRFSKLRDLRLDLAKSIRLLKM